MYVRKFRDMSLQKIQIQISLGKLQIYCPVPSWTPIYPSFIHYPLSLNLLAKYSPLEKEQKLHYKIKRNIMNKFLNEPVDAMVALDLRLTKAEALLAGMVDDPWKVKSEKDRGE